MTFRRNVVLERPEATMHESPLFPSVFSSALPAALSRDLIHDELHFIMQESLTVAAAEWRITIPSKQFATWHSLIVGRALPPISMPWPSLQVIRQLTITALLSFPMQIATEGSAGDVSVDITSCLCPSISRHKFLSVHVSASIWKIDVLFKWSPTRTQPLESSSGDHLASDLKTSPFTFTCRVLGSYFWDTGLVTRLHNKHKPYNKTAILCTMSEPRLVSPCRHRCATRRS